MEYSRAAFAQLFLRAAQDAAAAAASARGQREQEAILLLSVSYSALWAECRFSVLQNAQVPGMGRTKKSKNQIHVCVFYIVVAVCIFIALSLRVRRIRRIGTETSETIFCVVTPAKP